MIEYQNLSLHTETNGTILKNLNFTIQEGEFFVLIGPSGSGKTTTLKLINRLIEANEGYLYFRGKRIKDFDLRQLRLETGYVFQQVALFPNMTVRENIGLIPEMKGMRKAETLARTRTLLSKVGLDPDIYLDRYPQQLSGGEAQRVGILRAVIASPKVLLMDEPFSALDPITRVQLQNLIKTLHQDLGMTTVFVTHDMEEAVKLADRICLMQNGEVVQVGTVSQLQQQPANAFVKAFFNHPEEM